MIALSGKLEKNKKKPGNKSGQKGAKRSRVGEGLPRNLREIYSAALLLIGAILVISVYWHLAGPVGRGIDLFLSLLMGKLRFIVPPLVIIISALIFLGFIWGPPKERMRALRLGWVEATGMIIILLGLCAIFHVNNPTEEMFTNTVLKGGGGIVGASISWPLVRLMSKVGAIVLMAGMLIIGFFMLTGLSISVGLQKRVERRRERLLEKRKLREEEKRRRDAQKVEKSKERVEPKAVKGELDIVQAGGLKEEEDMKKKVMEINVLKSMGEKTLQESPMGGRGKEQLSLGIKELPKIGPHYLLPPLNLLRKTDSASSISRKSMNESIRVVEKTLRDFDVDAAVTRVTRGPTVTRFEVELGSGVKVNRILNLVDDIAYALASPEIRIIAPIPGRSAIGIEVPNPERDLVTLGDILSLAEVQARKEPLIAALGKDIAGQPVLVNIPEMPHLLLAGATGSGKSCCINTLIVSILFKSSPDDVKFLMIDPKYVELSHFNGIPHLLAPVINEPKKASAALSWVVKEMEERYKTLSRAGVKNIEFYKSEYENGLKKEMDEEGKPLFHPMNYIVVIIDELADLMMVSPVEVEESIARIAQMARAVGIHLVVATQRPSVDVVTGLIKANIPSRIAFTVASQADSRVILDTGGAEKLVGHGDMLFLPSGRAKPIRVQGAYVSEKEIEAAVAFIKRQRAADYRKDILSEIKQDSEDTGKADALLEKAMETVIRSGIASASFLQRKLGVGYARAARLIDLLEEKGVVGGYEGSKPRAVLMTLEEWEKLKEKKEGGAA